MKLPESSMCALCNAWRGQFGLEPVLDCLGWAAKQNCGQCYLCHIRLVLRECWRVLKDDGVMFWNIGDSYAGAGHGLYKNGLSMGTEGPKQQTNTGSIGVMSIDVPIGLKPKDLCLVPARFALAAQADGWYVRSKITWAKRAPMPESVTDRPTSATEDIYLLAKSERYYWDAEAVREPAAESSIARISQPNFVNQKGGDKDYRNGVNSSRSARKALENFAKNPGANLKNFWLLSPDPYPDAHYATFPREIPRRCILAGTRIGDLVLDPFGGSGTVGEVAEQLGRRWICLELSSDYLKQARTRTAQQGLRL